MVCSRAQLFLCAGLILPRHSGLDTPVRKQLSKSLYSQAPSTVTVLCDILRALWAVPQRECQYFALEYAEKHKKIWTTEDMLPVFEEVWR